MSKRSERVVLVFLGFGLICLCSAFFTINSFVTAQTSISAAASDSVKEVLTKTHPFFDGIVKGNTSSRSLFEELLRGGPLAPQSMTDSTFNDVVKKYDELKRLGPPLGYDLIDDRLIGSDLIILRFIVKHEFHPVIWTITFYRKPVSTPTTSNQNQWRVIGLRFDTNLDILSL
ncbi:MAG: hypothetical protein ACRCUY_14205 [Thermoguttaceae bacterium]